MTNPRETYGFALKHIGINCENQDEALKNAKFFEALFGFGVSETPISYFAGTEIETMKFNGYGTNGHIAISCNDVAAAKEYVESIGFTCNADSAAYNEDGSLKLIYINGEVGGFAVHLAGK